MPYINRVVTEKFPFKSLAAATTLTASQSGTTFGLALSGGFTVTLPAVAEGIKYTFVATIAPGTSYIISGAAGDLIYGLVNSSTGGNAVSTAGNPADAINFAGGVAAIGDQIEVFSDGTYWYAKAVCDADGGVTFTDA